VDGPEIVPADDEPVTVTTTVLEQLVPRVYDIVVVPPEMPVTTPAADTVATETLELLHTPPGVASESVVLPEHATVVDPVITAGNGFTVTTLVVRQPVAKT
jgi:hypothetical protein